MINPDGVRVLRCKSGSIVSKKAAEGLKALILDVKVGKAAMLSDETDARQLGRQLVNSNISSISISIVIFIVIILIIF